MNAAQYRQLLAEYGLQPAPGYFSANFHSETADDIVEAAKRHAAMQAELGNTEVFIAPKLTPERMEHPAIGFGGDEATLRRVIDGLGAAAAAITAEGVTPALHPHVGSPVEIEPEVRAVFDAITASDLSSGPDTGHLAWAGMTPSMIMADYADRIAAVHLKDVHLDQADQARAADADYMGRPFETSLSGRSPAEVTSTSSQRSIRCRARSPAGSSLRSMFLRHRPISSRLSSPQPG